MRRHFFEGVALDQPPRAWAWTIGYVGFAIASSVAEDDVTDPRRQALAIVIAISSGAVWQLLSRRDIADRMLLLSLLVGFTALVQYIPGAVVEPTGWPYSGFCGLTAGLVLTELAWRRVDARTREGVAAAP